MYATLVSGDRTLSGDVLEQRGDRVVIAGQVVEYLRGEIETEGLAI